MVNSSFNTTLITFFPATFISSFFIPINVNNKTGSPVTGILIAYFPFKSVTTPELVPFNRIVTPGKGTLSCPTTFPVIVCVCTPVTGTAFRLITTVFCWITYPKPESFKQISKASRTVLPLISMEILPALPKSSALYTKTTLDCFSISQRASFTATFFNDKLSSGSSTIPYTCPPENTKTIATWKAKNKFVTFQRVLLRFFFILLI